MPRFEPFRGVRYAEDVDLDAVTCPPYDVISPSERARLVDRHPANAIRVELPEPEDGLDRYAAAAQIFDRWLADGVLVEDDEPAFYVYRMGFRDEAGRPRQTAGVIGALGVEPPGDGDVLPHERTMPKPKSDRLDLLRATRANLSPVWGLSMAEGLSGLCELPGPPTARATDEDGVHHRLYRVTQAGVLDAVSAAVAAQPVVIADGHHRYQTALAYQAERREAGGGDGPHDLIMALVVELAEEQLSVRAIHRLVSGLPEGVDLRAVLEAAFELEDAGRVDESVTVRMVEAGALCLVERGGRGTFLRPRPATVQAAPFDLDSSLLDVALAALPEHELTFQHGWDNVVAAVDAGEAQAGVLLRPATVDQIIRTGRARTLMPQKTTFFWPKPRTGLVFRRL